MKKTSAVSERAYGGVPPEQRLEARRQAFLHAGIRLFGKNGYRTTTVRQLCSEAKLTERYFYESFESTEDLLCAAFNEINSHIEQRIAATVEQSPEELRSVGHASLSVFFEAMQDPIVARLVLFEVLGVSSRVDQLYQQNNFRFAAALSAVLNRFTGGLKPVSSEMYVYLGLIGAISHMAMNWYLGGYRETRETLVESAYSIIEGCMKD